MRSTIATAPGWPRTPFNSPALLQLLARWAADGDAAARPALAALADARASPAERLGQWLDWTDAITLSAALNQGAPATTATPACAGPRQDPAMAAQALARVQARQAQLIRSDPVCLVVPDSDSTADAAPYRRACLARQRAMDAAIAALRAQLRSMLAASSPALARLALLDATLETALAERERHLLGTVVARLEQRFVQLRQAAAPGWLAAFQQDMQRALLAELDLRLQPAQGLVAALGQAGPA